MTADSLHIDERAAGIENEQYPNYEKNNSPWRNSNATVSVNGSTEVGDESVKSLPDVDDLPDGGYGWFVVLGAFMVLVTTFGVSISWGVMQDYYQQNLFYDDPNAALNLSFVGTIILVFFNLMSPVGQILASIFDSRIVMLLGTFCITLSLEMAGFSSQVWHLYLSQGVLFGFGASMLYVTIMGIAPQWFNRRRGLALGIIVSGSGVGGLIMPFIMQPINAKLGAPWTYRVIGFVCLLCDVVACILVKDKYPRIKGRKRLQDIIQLKVLKNVDFIIWVISADLCVLGYYVPYFFLPSYATHIGLSDSQGSSLVAISSACNFLGRVFAGYLADRIGKLNTHTIFTFIGGLSSLLIWTFAYSYGTLVAFSVILGFFAGTYFSLLSPVTLSILGMEMFPSGLSLLLVFNVASVFGPSIASAIEGAVDSEPFLSYKLFTGISFILGGVVLIILKLRLNKNIFAKI
ncbi:major facilitator superfamily domain-containing protein [Radiomyces spectabilis]|uniref:major facilitator superfamily domain-containing protein n=1 Tax=Radiomyces spectabilis TaxID=64574 RepID=UPI0022205B8D|nr:major facilitator superfamily domain-containing protein [Radiomyces spectabilis]KAI8394330.1 major facilitator superfamily domain-containing protein [Radiomyces spectabilis]